ncbi:nitrilase-related carbon-nitrogen hydrolase [Paenibacillus thermotolerans]|uniref:nitrilase-related carbon-nitrogen hydrolase n=1 Tax=Paenibacillus thermotolerans TaxID=3027807 RepID=UPI002367F91D|nr:MULTISPECIES: nitrilase-related carbon-nitrogen hydrolase [unclassified Paenibacillus]
MTLSAKSPSFLLSLALAAASGGMLLFSMPGYDLWYLAWIALVPLLLAVRRHQGLQRYILFNITGLIWSIGCHAWFPDVLGKGLGMFLMVASGLLYGFFLQLGCDLQQRFKHYKLSILIVPVVWTALEWLRFVLPVTRDWWIEVLAKTQWTVPENLQILSVTGFPGLSFLIVLTNTAIAAILIKLWKERRPDRTALALLLIPVAVLSWGKLTVDTSYTSDTFTVAAHADLANQDPEIVKLGGGTTAGDGYLADTEAMSQAIFDVNEALTLDAAKEAKPAFVVWGENEFTSYGNEAMIGKLKELAATAHTHIVADVVWNSDAGMHDTALLIGPDGAEIGKTAKINITGGEEEYGFVPGQAWGSVFDTAYGMVGLGVCWDRHTTGIVRALSRNGARLVLMPVDDDFNANPLFPHYAASDTVFRAVENRAAIVTGSTAGMSQVITPFGEVTAASGINTREWISGETFTVQEQSVYTRYGDWFGNLAAACFVLIVGLSAARKKKPK